jgi:hypothetical protein
MLYLLAEIAASDGAAFMVDEFSRENESVACGPGCGCWVLAGWSESVR